MKKLLTLFLITFNLFTISAHAEPKDNLSGLLKNMHSFKANFTQTILNKHGKAIQKSTGQMELQRPNQFRWDVRSPSKQLIVTNGKKLWIYDPDLDQVTIRSLVKTAGETPAMLLSDENLALGDEFTVKSLSVPGSSLEWFLLIPHDQGTVISSLKLGFANKQIQKMQIQDHLGHTTAIEFINGKMNGPLSSASFVFKPPANVDVIDETKSKR
jgi:outer membrane lipoprotein carrier protein